MKNREEIDADEKAEAEKDFMEDAPNANIGSTFA
jgi:hypothetical protein